MNQNLTPGYAPPNYPPPYQPYPAYPPPPPPGRGPRTALIAAVAAVVLAGGGVGAYFAFKGDDKPHTKLADPVPSVSASASAHPSFPAQPSAPASEQPSQVAGAACTLPDGATEEAAEIGDDYSLLATSLTSAFTPDTLALSFSADTEGHHVHSLCWDDISQAQLDELGDSLLSTWKVDQLTNDQQVYLAAPDDTTNPQVVAVTVSGGLTLKTDSGSDGTGSVEIDYF